MTEREENRSPEIEDAPLREEWSTPMLFRESVANTQLTASDSGGDIVWS